MITSTANTQVKELVKLMKKSRARDEAQVFLIEGPRMAGELVSDPGWRTKIEKIYLSESYAVKNERECESLEDTAAVEILSDPVFAHVSGTKTPQGILAVVKRRTYNMSQISLGMIRDTLTCLSSIIFRIPVTWERSSVLQRQRG